MAWQHSNVYIVRIVDVIDGDDKPWYVGPYGSTRANQVADELYALGREHGHPERLCYVEALFSDDECLAVKDYVRTTEGSLH